jgi:hypothetical protein
MRARILTAAILILFSRSAFATADLDSGRKYLEVYLKINEAEHFEKSSDIAGALKDFQECYDKLNAIHISNPDWETALVIHRLEDIRAMIIELQLKATAGKDSVSAQETLDKIRATYPGPVGMSIGAHHQTYPWKTNILPDVFWIGKDGAVRSAWDDNWVKTNGGIDSPDNRNGFSAAGHAAKLNPFYVALPFNDLAHPELAHQWLPKSWSRQPVNGKAVSACKDRWVCIKNTDGRSCYAQWEDAGPGYDDDAAYVFGKSVPKATMESGKPAFSVSPAVAEYLQLNDSGSKSSPVSWRFVNEEDVPPGAWLKYDEQALIYAAMNK